MKINYKMTEAQLLEKLTKLTGITDKNYLTDLNLINKFVLSKDGPFQVKFVRNVYLNIGHHDHQEIEAVLATPRIRIMSLLQTLEDK